MPTQMKPVVEQLLTGVSSALIPQGMVAEKIFPKVYSANYSGKLAKYGKDFLRIERSIVGGTGKYRQVKPITKSTDSFNIIGHGLEGMVTKQDYANSQQPYDAEKDETTGLTTHLLLEKEYAVAASLTDTAVLTQNTTLVGTDQYSDYLNSDPVSDFSDFRATVRAACGLAPDVAIMDWAVWNKLRYHPAILDALGFKDNRPGGLNEAELAMAIGVQRLFVAQGVYNSAKEGQADSITPIWGKHIVLAVLPQAAQPYQTSLGYEVLLTGGQPRKVYKQPGFNPPGSTSILVEDEYDHLISNASAAYLIKNAIA